MEPLPWVFKRLGLLGAFKLAFSCKKEQRCRQLMQQSKQLWGPNSAQRNAKHIMLKDIATRDPEKLPSHDLYVAGFPCQPFSSMGLGEGVADRHGRGRIVTHIVAALAAKQPRAFILENVSGLVTTRKGTFNAILKRLNAIGGGVYAVAWRVLNTHDHGVPQNRKRVYVVGIKKDQKGQPPKFVWPKPCPPKPLASLLEEDTTGGRKREAAFRTKASPKTVQKLRQLLKKVRSAGGNPRSVRCPCVFDLDGVAPHAMKNCCPCITRARGGAGFYLPSRGRRLTLGERLRLQGLPLAYLRRRQGVSDRQLGMMIGNAMSGNVLARLLAKLLPACARLAASSVPMGVACL